MCSPAAQAGSKPATTTSAAKTTSATETKTAPPSQSTEPASDTTAVAAVKQDTAAAAATPASEPVTSAAEPATVSKDEKNEDKAVTVEDSDSEGKMDTDTSEQNKTEEAKEEVSFISLYTYWFILPPGFNMLSSLWTVYYCS